MAENENESNLKAVEIWPQLFAKLHGLSGMPVHLPMWLKAVAWQRNIYIIEKKNI